MRSPSSAAIAALSISFASVMVLSALSGSARTTGAPPHGTAPLSSPGPQPTFAGTGLPTLDPDDGKFFGVAGTQLSTLEDVTIILNIGVPAGGTLFSVGIFDGDVGGRWDDGPAAFSYRIFKDPLKNGTTAKP